MGTSPGPAEGPNNQQRRRGPRPVPAGTTTSDPRTKGRTSTATRRRRSSGPSTKDVLNEIDAMRAAERAAARRPSRSKPSGPSTKDVLNELDAMRAAERAAKRAATPKPVTFTDDDKEQAKAAWETAFSLTGLVGDGGLICPACHTNKRKKVTFSTEKNYWKCFKCGEHGDTIGLVMAQLNVSFIEAVGLLIGKSTTEYIPRPIPKAVLDAAVSGRRSKVDYEVYEAVLTSSHSSLTAAQEFYATWHIDPTAVAEQRSVVVVAPAKLKAELVERFGEQRLIDAGLGTEAGTWPDGSPKPFGLLVTAKYPVVEPQIGPSGLVLNLQFRGSAATRAKVAAHKAGDGPYVAPFLSLAGQTETHLVGCGLERIGSLDEPTAIYIVEGFKDLLAARTLGAEAYAIPGAGIMPPPRVCRLFADGGHRLVVTLDGDDAGAAGRQRLIEHFATNGFEPGDDGSLNPRLRVKDDLPDGFDIADVLVDRHATGGCDCATCVAWRNRPVA